MAGLVASTRELAREDEVQFLLSGSRSHYMLAGKQ
jgi:hypothetical protein